jgi:DNA-binding winged helix-turn-helix (wHTH) protein
MSGETYPVDLALRLADEGVPLRAIARAVRLPADTVRRTLSIAKDEGRLLDLPREDWPPGFPRDPRAWQFSRMLVEDRTSLLVATQQVFGLTRTVADLLLALLQNQNLSKEARSDRWSSKTLDVHICALRRQLRPHRITIDTLWGFGYRLAAGSRAAIMDKIAAHIATSAAA